MRTGEYRDSEGDLIETAQRIRIIISSITLDGQHIGPQTISPTGYYVAAEGVVHRSESGDFFELQALYDAQGRKYALDKMIALRECTTSTSC
jgi:hypothetical protein